MMYFYLIFLFLHCFVSVQAIDNGGSISPRFLLVEDSRAIKLVYGNGSALTVIDGQNYLSSLDFDFQDKLVFYQDDSDKIKRKEIFAKSSPLTIAEPGHSVHMYSVSVEWVTKKVYWATDNGRIAVCTYNGDMCKVLLYDGLTLIRALSVDPINGHLYWINSETNEIERSSLDGSQRSTFIRSMRDSFAHSIAIDFASNQLYWTEGYLEGAKYRIKRCNVGVAGVTPTNPHIETVHPDKPAFFLAVFKNSLLWSRYNVPGIYSCFKYSCNKDFEPHAQEFRSEIWRVFEANTQPKRTKPNPCASHNGGCSHLCLLTPLPPYFTCACPTGIKLSEDGRNCAQGPSQILLIARRSDIRYLSLDTRDFTDILVNLKSVKHASAVDFDPVDKFIYWSDGDLKKISRAKLDATEESNVITSEVEQVDGIAVDWVARNMYWTDTGTDRIEVARLNGSARRTLIHTDLSQPRAIVLDPKHGYMYWSDWGTDPKIERAYLDGSHRKTLISLPKGSWPNGLALSNDYKLIYWIDAGSDRIEVADTANGANRTILFSDDLPHGYGFSLLDDQVYWSDWQRRSVERAFVNGTGREHISTELPDLMAIKAVQFNINLVENTCSHLNGGCSHLCLYTPHGRVCKCPPGWELRQDNTTCFVPAAFILFTQSNVTDISRISISRFPPNQERLRLHNVSQPIFIDYHYSQQKVFWTEFVKDVRGAMSSRMYSAYLNGSRANVIIDRGLGYVQGIAVDWIANNIYWTDSQLGTVSVSRLDGSCRRVIVWRDTKPRAIVIDPNLAYIYWADITETPTIQRCNVDGSNRIGLMSDVGKIHAMAMDQRSRRIFWSVVENSASIWTADINGDNRRRLVSGDVIPYALDHYEDKVYFSDWRKHSIETIATNLTDQTSQTLHSRLSGVGHLVIVHSLKQKGWNQCAIRNGGCAQLCFATPIGNDKVKDKSNVICKCQTHYFVDNLGYCRAPTSFILLAMGNEIHRWKLNDPITKSKFKLKIEDLPEDILRIGGLRQPRCLQYDPVEEYIYWIDQLSTSSRKQLLQHVLTIVRAKQNESVSELVSVRDGCVPRSFALNPFSRQIYVVCRDEHHASIDVMVIRPDNKLKWMGAVIQHSPYKPSLLALHIKFHRLIFVDTFHRPRIFNCDGDGKNCRVILDSREKGNVPMDLHVDEENHRIFFTQGRSLIRMDLNGEGRRDVLVAFRGQLHLTTFAGHLLFESLRFGSLVGGISTGDDLEQSILPARRITHLTGLLAVDGSFNSNVHNSSCLKNPCSHLCKPNFGSKWFTCECPVGMVVESEGSTVCREAKTCAHWQWQCNDGRQCLHMRLRCDGIAQCSDASDEIGNCDICKPPGSGWACQNGLDCIPWNTFCDGKADCSDSSDEMHCRCEEPDELFDCTWSWKTDNLGNPRCISRRFVCDTTVQCYNGTDELMCPYTNNIADSTKNMPISKEGTQILILAVIFLSIFIVVVLFALACHHFYRKNRAAAGQEQMQMVNLPNDSFGTAHTNTTNLTNTFNSRPMIVRTQMISELHLPSGEVLTHTHPVQSTFQQFTRTNYGNLTGKSSSSGVTVDTNPFPEQVNPPPSMVTVSAKPRHSRAHRPRRRKRRQMVPPSPPPPYDAPACTPCSTEVLGGDSFDDLDEEMVGGSGVNIRRRGNYMNINKKYDISNSPADSHHELTIPLNPPPSPDEGSEDS